MMLLPIGAIPIQPQPKPKTDYDKRRVRARRELETYKRLADALYDWLAEPVLQDLEDTDTEEREYMAVSSVFVPTIEHLHQACSRRDAIQQQLDAMNEQADNLEKQIGGKADGMVGMLRASLIMPLEMQLKDAEEWVSNIQRQMESAQA